MDKIIGKKLDGRYEITELIGTGGMADVYKGMDVVENKAVAVKILKNEYSENEEFLRRFRNESKAIAVLNHPNIVKIYDVGFTDSIQYIIMEYIDGETLKEYITKEDKVSWKDTIHFVVQILRALQHAHDKGVVHRDIKPQNIMVFNDGTVKVMDFGIAKFARDEGKTATDQAIGSVHYISPEQASGATTDAKSDIYSVGVMMYEMLTGKKPFDSDNPVAIALMHTRDIPERPRAVNPDIPDGLEEIVLRAMEKDPSDRYQNADEMIEDLEKFKADPSVRFGYYQEEEENAESTRFFNTQADINAAQALGQAQQPQQQYAAVQQYAGQPQGYQQMQPQPQYAGVRAGDEYYDDDDDDDDDEDDRPSLVVPVLTAIVVVVILVAVIFIVTMLSSLLKESSQKNDFTMPDFYGMDYNDAKNQYSNSINFQEAGSEWNELDAGKIFWQDIPPETEFRKGDVLKVKISKGMETVEVPRVAGMNAEIAKDQLRARGLECEIKNSSSAEVKKGDVIKTDPEGGQEVHKGMTVLLYVSMGIDAGQVSVEDYVGLTAEDAVTLAEYRNLKPKTESVASYEPEGKVVKQSLNKGDKVDAGTEILFSVSNGKNPDGEIVFTARFPGDANGRFVLDFMLKDADGKMTTTSSTTILCPEMSSTDVPIKGSGEHVDVTVSLTNLNTQRRTVLGTYVFNFATSSYTATSEDVWKAFNDVGAFGETPTEETPTEAPQETPQEQVTDPPAQQPGVNGDFRNGVWTDYVPGSNGNTHNGAWDWYNPGQNGAWMNDGSWQWYENGQNGQWVDGVWQFFDGQSW